MADTTSSSKAATIVKRLKDVLDKLNTLLGSVQEAKDSLAEMQTQLDKVKKDYLSPEDYDAKYAIDVASDANYVAKALLEDCESGLTDIEGATKLLEDAFSKPAQVADESEEVDEEVDEDL
jgi:archaellum component FlaC